MKFSNNNQINSSLFEKVMNKLYLKWMNWSEYQLLYNNAFKLRSVLRMKQNQTQNNEQGMQTIVFTIDLGINYPGVL